MRVKERVRESVRPMSLKMNASWYIDVYGWMDRYLEGRERLSEREHKGLFNKRG